MHKCRHSQVNGWKHWSQSFIWSEELWYTQTHRGAKTCQAYLQENGLQQEMTWQTSRMHTKFTKRKNKRSEKNELSHRKFEYLWSTWPFQEKSRQELWRWRECLHQDHSWGPEKQNMTFRHRQQKHDEKIYKYTLLRQHKTLVQCRVNRHKTP